MIATTLNCPLCPLTVLARGADETESAVAAIDALDQHITEHHQGDQ